MMRGEQKRALFLIGDKVELYPPDSASPSDIEMRGVKTKIRAVQFGADPEFHPSAELGFLATDLWVYRLDLEGNLSARRFREDWLRRRSPV